MSLKIELDHGSNSSQHYYPGQTLTGKVIANFTKQQSVTITTITFRGKIDTEYIESRAGSAGNTHGPRRRAHETIRLFEIQHTLFQGPYDVIPQTFEWPFMFNIPVDCNHTRVGNTSPGFIPDGPSLLPPTFEHIETTFAHDARCRVKYKLVAAVQSGGMFKNHSTELPVQLSRCSMTKAPWPVLIDRPFRPSPNWSSSSLREQSLTFKQKLKHITSSDPELQTPCIAFGAFIHFPEQLAPEQQASIAFSIRHKQITQNDPEAPILMLQSVKLQLKAQFAMLASKSGIPSLSGDRYCDSQAWAADKVLLFNPMQLSLTGEKAVLTDSFQLSEWSSRPKLIGEFSTYTIRTHYKIRVEAEVRHPATGHIFIMRNEFPFRVLDQYRDMVPANDQNHGQTAEVDHELPAYDEDRPPEHEDAQVILKA